MQQLSVQVLAPIAEGQKEGETEEAEEPMAGNEIGMLHKEQGIND